MSTKLKDEIIAALSNQSSQIKEIITITVDNNDNYIFRSSFPHPADEVYALECTRMQILFNEYMPDQDKLN